MRLLLIVIIFLGIFSTQAPSETQPKTDSPEPSQLIVKLLRMQEELAHGNLPPQENLRNVIDQIGEKFKESPPEVWQIRRNAEALVIYTVSGGNPALLRDLLGNGTAIAMDMRILSGTLAYSEGSEKTAIKLLGTVNHRNISPTIAAHIALIKAALMSKINPYDALALYDDVRLLAPGTLLEEAALRREAFVAVNAKNRELFYSISAKYFRTYNQSKFIKSFQEQFAAYVANFKNEKREQEFKKISKAIDILPDERREVIYTSIAKRSIAKGNLNYALRAALAANSIFQEASPKYHQLRLYEAAAQIFSGEEEYKDSTETLINIPASQLTQEDRELHRVTLLVAKQIIHTPEPSDPILAPDYKNTDSADMSEQYQMLSYIKNIENRIKETDQIIEEKIQ